MSEPVKKIEYHIPNKLTSDQEGYEFLCYLSLKTYLVKNEEITFDFSKNTYFEANLCSPFGALLEFLKERANSIIFKDLQQCVAAQFRKNGFYEIINPGFVSNDSLATIMEFKKFTLEDISSFQDYINDRLLAQDGFPILSNLLKKKINSSILEIFNNCHSHGNCEFVYTCGEYSPDDSILRFAISDMGKTIRKNVNDYFKSGSDMSGEKAIVWAVEPGNTTKSGLIPGGLGLHLIRDFLRLNGGSMQIISSNGYWEEKKGITFATTFKNRFLGTIVNFEFNLKDRKSYVLSSEIDPKKVL